MDRLGAHVSIKSGTGAWLSPDPKPACRLSRLGQLEQCRLAAVSGEGLCRAWRIGRLGWRRGLRVERVAGNVSSDDTIKGTWCLGGV